MWTIDAGVKYHVSYLFVLLQGSSKFSTQQNSFRRALPKRIMQGVCLNFTYINRFNNFMNTSWHILSVEIKV